ncbi:MAG TPA: TonB-dependent receptor [Kofleriaceae bacterium]
MRSWPLFALGVFCASSAVRADDEVSIHVYSGDQLAALGATNLASALGFVPDILVRTASDGVPEITLRGARGGQLSVRVDGVDISEPYFESFDVTTIPILDIATIRVSSAPRAALDGQGGLAGAIDITTRDGCGSHLVIARLVGDTSPGASASLLARESLSRTFGVRIAAGIGGASRELDAGDTSVHEMRRDANGSLRLEYRSGARRIALEGAIDDAHFLAPPFDASHVMLVDEALSERGTGLYDDAFGKLTVHGTAFFTYSHLIERGFGDLALSDFEYSQNLETLRTGAAGRANYPVLSWLGVSAAGSLSHDAGILSDQHGAYERGSATILDGALGAHAVLGQVRIDGSAGVVGPGGTGAYPFPEATLGATYHVLPQLDLAATGALKTRLPTLYERYDPTIGTAALAPERDAIADVRAIGHIDRVQIEVAPYYRRAWDGIETVMGKYTNVTRETTLGVDARGTVQIFEALSVGGAYDFVHVKQLADSANDPVIDDPIDGAPRVRAQAWATAAPLPGLALFARISYASRSYDTYQAMDVILPAYVVVDATASYALSSSYAVILRGEDLGNERPETRATYHEPGRTLRLILQGTWR